jgi:hypothetical protein
MDLREPETGSRVSHVGCIEVGSSSRRQQRRLAAWETSIVEIRQSRIIGHDCLVYPRPSLSASYIISLQRDDQKTCVASLSLSNFCDGPQTIEEHGVLDTR